MKFTIGDPLFNVVKNTRFAYRYYNLLLYIFLLFIVVFLALFVYSFLLLGFLPHDQWFTLGFALTAFLLVIHSIGLQKNFYFFINIKTGRRFFKKKDDPFLSDKYQKDFMKKMKNSHDNFKNYVLIQLAVAFSFVAYFLYTLAIHRTIADSGIVSIFLVYFASLFIGYIYQHKMFYKVVTGPTDELLLQLNRKTRE